jgi:thiol:disulfide interchange protein DsbD
MKTQVTSVLTALSFLALGLAGQPKASAETPHPIHWALSATAESRLPLRKGSTLVAHLYATIQPGWHLYALDQEPGGPTATRISLTKGRPFTLSGDIDESTPMTAIDPNFNLQTHFFLGEAHFTIPLKVSSAVKNKAPVVAVDVLYQTCNDTMCLPPTVAHVTSEVKR